MDSMMRRSSVTHVLMATACLAVLAGCSNAKQKLGLTHKAPDEFTVVKRAPLEMPPDYYLRPPQPGAERPQEASETDKSREYVFGETRHVNTADQSASDILLQQAGADSAHDNIRTIVDEETAQMPIAEKSVAKKLFGGKSDKPSASVVDPSAEAERIRQNKEAGAPVTEGNTPTITDE